MLQLIFLFQLIFVFPLFLGMVIKYMLTRAIMARQDEYVTVPYFTYAYHYVMDLIQ